MRMRTSHPICVGDGPPDRPFCANGHARLDDLARLPRPVLARGASTRFLKIAGVLIAGLLAIAAYGQNSPSDISAKVGLDQKLNAQVPLDLSFRAETGEPVRLGGYFGKRPVILVLAYYECPNLCTLVLSALLTSAQDLKFDAGKDFEIVVVSFDPRETPALAMAKKRTYTQLYGRPEDAGGWHFLTGEEPAIAQLANSVGFRYTFDPQTKQYAHPSAIMVLTPDGKISRYFAGIEYPPKELRLALIEASNHRIGSLTEQLFLLCFHYNPLIGKYGLVIMRVIRIACFATVAALALFMTLMFRRDRRESTRTRTGR
jgi:protein SCO1/2